MGLSKYKSNITICCFVIHYFDDINNETFAYKSSFLPFIYLNIFENSKREFGNRYF